MHHLAALYSSVNNGTTYGNLAAVLDQSLTTSQNGNFILPDNWSVFGAYVSGANLLGARLNAPSLRTLVLPELYPTNVSANNPSRPPWYPMGDYGPKVLKNEEVNVQVSVGGGAASDNFALLWMGRTRERPGMAPSYRAVATFTGVTLVKGQWVNAPLTFSTILPAGQYNVIGMAVVCAACLAGRLVYPGQNSFRPGCLADVAYGNFVLPPGFLAGQFDNYGSFQNTAQPSIELLGTAAGAQSGTVYLDLVKTM